MIENQISERRRGVALLASMALVGALLVPFGLVVTAGPSGASGDCRPIGVTQGPEDHCCPEDFNGGGGGVTQGGEITDVCCASELIPADDQGVTQGNNDLGVKCCPDGTFGHWQWGGTNGQNLYYCDAPPSEPPATAAPATDPPAVSPATAAPKKAAAAKPTFTG